MVSEKSKLWQHYRYAYNVDRKHKENEGIITSDDLGIKRFWSNYLHWQGDIKVLKIIIEEADAEVSE